MPPDHPATHAAALTLLPLALLLALTLSAWPARSLHPAHPTHPQQSSPHPASRSAATPNPPP
ncbi:hypothetical protein ACFVVX_19155 [Kitasatospora sp. NPDC058170]|uniref:hypothetical protein n=1 Tax=Kitasatospora sp. NPDC058170 TaxID=3346364 RepID=UPI0036DE8A1B